MQYPKIPKFVALLYNDNQIMFNPDSDGDAGWENITLTFGNHDTISIYSNNEIVGIIKGRSMLPIIIGTNDFYLGWFDKDNNLLQRKINVNTLSLFPVN